MSRILWFHPRPVLPPRGGGQVRTLGLITCAVQAGHEVMLVQPAGAPGFDFPDGVQLVEVALRRGPWRTAAKVLSRFPLRAPQATRGALGQARTRIELFDPDVSVVSEVLGLSIASSLPSEKPWIYDAHNVETALYRSFRDDAANLFDRMTFAIDYRRVAALERRAVTECSALVTVSAEDTRGLTALGPVALTVVVPSSVPSPDEPATPATSEPVVLFVGSLDYPPNAAALDELITVVLPALRAELRDARLVVVGRRPSRHLREQLATASWAELREDVADLGPCYREARCVILPIRSGSGSRLKVYEALSYGIPLVATVQALGGVPLTPGLDVLVGDQPDDLAQEAMRVLADDALAHDVGAAGRETFLQSLSWSQVSAPLTALLEELSGSG